MDCVGDYDTITNATESAYVAEGSTAGDPQVDMKVRHIDDWMLIVRSGKVPGLSFTLDVRRVMKRPSRDEDKQLHVQCQVVTVNHPTVNGRLVSRQDLAAFCKGELLLVFDQPQPKRPRMDRFIRLPRGLKVDPRYSIFPYAVD